MFDRLLNRQPRSTPAPAVPLVLYSRADCHLCEVMKQQLAGARLSEAWELCEVDIDTDEELVARFGESIPVLEIGGRVAFKGRLEVAALERKFERLAAAWRAGQPSDQERSK